MNITAQEIANIIGGTIYGNPKAKVNSVAKIEEASPGSLCFLSNNKYKKHIYNSDASIIIVNNSFKSKKKINTTLIKVEDAYSAFSQLLELYNKMKIDQIGISKKADVDDKSSIGEYVYIGAFTSICKGVKIGKNVKIHPNCYIGDNTKIGDNTIIFPNTTIYHGCEIGKNNILHSGVIIGSDGFGFAPDNKNYYNKISQIGDVIISDNVEIGANTTVDRATMGSTKINSGVKLDNLIQIGHNVEIGSNTVIAAQTCIAGSSKIGQNCMIGGQVAIADHIQIGDNVKIAGKSGVIKNISSNQVIQGPLAFNIKDFQKSYIHFKNLDNLYSDIKKLKEK